MSEKTIWKILGGIFCLVGVFAYTSVIIMIPILFTVFIIAGGL